MERLYKYVENVFETVILVLLFFIVLPIRLIDGLVYKTTTK